MALLRHCPDYNVMELSQARTEKRHNPFAIFNLSKVNDAPESVHCSVADNSIAYRVQVRHLELSTKQMNQRELHVPAFNDVLTVVTKHLMTSRLKKERWYMIYDTHIYDTIPFLVLLYI